MADEFLYSQSEALVALVLLALLFACAEAGYRLGLRRQSRIGESAKSRLDSIQSAILVLVGAPSGLHSRDVRLPVRRTKARCCQ